ncbi:MAG: hypothetical protein LBT52_03840, partial [Clostridiales Family XIII bacterium]|nr:hypothetical protein [Clostridiales Family XIII bacterium]
MRKQLQVVLVGLLLLQAIFFPAFFPSVSAVSAASGGMSNDGAAGARLKTGIAENTLTILNTSHIKRTGTSQDSDASSSDDAFGAHGASGDNGAPGADDISSTNDTSAGDGAPSAGETSGDGGVLTLSLDALLSVTSPDKELPELSISGNFTPLPIPASDEDAEISGDIVNAADGKIGTWRILPRDAVGESQSSGESYSDEKSHVVALSLSSIKIGAKKIHLDITGTYDAGSESGAASGTAGMPVRVTVSGGAFVDIDVPSDSATNESATNEGSAGAQSATSQTSEEGIALQDAADNNNAKDGRKSGSITIARAAMDVADLFALYAPADRFADNVDVTYTPDNPVTVTSTVNVNFPFSIPPEVQAMMQNGDYADMPMPSGLKVTALQSGTLEDGPTTYGSYTIDPATNTMHIVFTNPGAVPPEGGFINYNVHFDTAIIQTPGEKVFYFPTKTQLPPFSVVVHPTVASSISKAGHSDAVTNPQNITWNVDFNRDYQTLTNAAIAEAFPAEVTFASVAVYPLTLDLNGNVQSVGAAPLTAGTDYTVDAGGNISFLRTISQPYRLVYQTRINDDAKPQAGGTLNAHNEATLSSDTTTPITAAATVALTYGKMLAKSETYYHTKTQTYDWSIQYNYGQKTIPTGVAIIDTLSNNMALFDSNNAPSQSPVLSPGGVPTLYYMNFNAAGTAVKGDPVPADAYTIVTTDAALHGFSVTFNDNIRQNSAIGIYYTTQVTDVVHDNTSTTVTNNVSQSGVQQPPPISKKPQQKMVIKDTPTINRGAKIAHWTLTLNYNNYRITNAAFTDTMNGTALGYISLPYAVSDGDPSTIPDMPKVSLKTTGGQTLTQGTDYELIVTTSGAIGYDSFTIKLIGAYADTTAAFDLSYYTQYNITAIAPGPKYTYTNNMTATWNTDGHPYTATGTSSFSDSQEEADQSMKSGSYNPLTKEITWTMVVNYNDITTGAIAVLDTFHGNQVYVPGSLEIYRGHISSTSGIFVRASSGSSSGSPSTQYSVNQTAYAGGGTDAANYIALGTTLGDESTLSASDIATTGSAADGTRESQFVISIGKGSGSTVTTSIPGIYDPGFIPMVFQIIYKTSLADTVITGAAAYQNDLQTGIVAATPYYSSISALVSVAYGGEEVAKTGAYSAATNQVNWSLWINRSQSTLLDAKLVDDPSTNQTLLPGSFKVYEGNVAADGTVTTGAAVAASKYTVTITTNPSTGQQEFTVDFGNITSSGAISKPYLVTYSTTPNFTSQTETVNNTAQIYSTGGALVGPPATHSETVKLESSSGIAWGKKGSLTINKTNPSYGAIEGAVFQLIRHWTIANPPADQVISTGTTDAAGNLTFGNLIYSPSNSSFIYILKETSTPNGYTIPDALVSGVQVTVND